MRHAFIDIETLSTNPFDGVIIDCSVMVVDHDKMLSSDPYTCRSITDILKIKFSVADQVNNYGYKVCPETMDFWKSQPSAARKHISPKSDDMTLEEGMTAIMNHLTNSGRVKYWWTRGNNFDPIFLQRAARDTGTFEDFKRKLGYSYVRDTRSYFDAKLGFENDNSFCPIQDKEFWDKIFVKHDSRWDVLADMLRLQAVLRAENDLEIINR